MQVTSNHLIDTGAGHVLAVKRGKTLVFASFGSGDRRTKTEVIKDRATKNAVLYWNSLGVYTSGGK